MYSKQETRKNIKSTLTVDESRRKREDKLKSLRKEKKEELLQKRRKGGEEEDKKDSNLEKKLQNLPKLVKLLNSNDKKEQLEATIQFRKLLSIEKNPPIDEVIEEGCLPIFVKFLQVTDFPQLQFEAAWAITNIASGTSQHTEKVIQENAVAVFIKLLSSNYDDVREQAVWALGNIAGDSTKCRNFVLKSGVLPPLLKLITENPKISLLRNSTWTLSNLCRGKPIPEFSLVSPSLSVLKVLLYSEDEEILTDSCWAISYLSDGPNDRIQAVIDSGVVGRLTELLQHNQTTVQTPALRTIGNIVTGTDNQTQVIIKSGALQYVGALLKHSKKSLRKEACWTISNITAGNKDQIQSIIDSGLIPPLITILEKDEFDVKKEAAWALSNATSGGTPNQIQYLVQKGCIKPLCDLLVEKDVKIINVALEGLENILNAGAKNENENPYCDIIDEAGGIEKIEELQHHENNDIYDKSSRIIEQFFVVDQEDMGDEDMKNNELQETFNF